MKFWDFSTKTFFDDRIFFPGWSNFRKIWKSQIFEKSNILNFPYENWKFHFFSKIRDFKNFWKFDQLEKKIRPSKKVFFEKSQNIIERPFRNTQQLFLTPPDRGERAISTWSSKWFLRKLDFCLPPKIFGNFRNVRDFFSRIFFFESDFRKLKIEKILAPAGES